MRSSTSCAHHWMQRRRGHAGRSFTKGVEASVPKAEDERKRSRAQPPTSKQRMGEEEASNHWGGVLSNGQHIANSSGPNY
jgi:hypothetical protein